MAAPDRIPHRLSPCLVVIDEGAPSVQRASVDAEQCVIAR
ncbi:hypothetical protein MYA_1320 [Burkholderia sp. KJ006]|nr:hypothetical protein MYA_1320 [Burkholderia sp. KJ006]